MGTVFKMTPAGVVTTIYNFSGLDGQNPDGGLTLGPDGYFSGTTGGAAPTTWEPSSRSVPPAL